MRTLRFLILVLILSFGCKRDEEDHPLYFTPIDLDAFTKDFRGFNLLGKFDAGWSNYGYSEEEFIIMHDLGFNFARLPIDYRTYTQPGNWYEFIDGEIAEIDSAVAWGKKYGVHVCINLHRAPGYCVNPSALPSNQNLDLWTNETAQKAFADHWAYFAKRYKDVPYNELSFNLVNEPGDMDENTYVNVMKKAIVEIQNINPDRVIFVDGLNYSRDLMMTLRNEKNVIQAIHVYDPFTLTHYKAEWVDGSDTWPVPYWPMTDISNYLYGPDKSEFHSSLVLEGSFPKDSQVTVNVQQVSVRSTMQIKLNDTEIYSKAFVCGADLGEDWTRIVSTQWGYQNISGKDYSVVLPTDGTKLTFTNKYGDWMTVNKITVGTATGEVIIIPANTTWGSIQAVYKITAEGKITDSEGNAVIPLRSLDSNLALARSESIPVMIQEFGVYNKTPYSVTLDYLDDVVSVFNKNHVGFAMWNMIGTMGIIDSERADCNYEDYRGKLLDRPMTNIMKKTGVTR